MNFAKAAGLALLLACAAPAIATAQPASPSGATNPTANDPSVGMPSTPGSMSGQGALLKDSPTRADGSVPGTGSGNHHTVGAPGSGNSKD